MDENKKTLAVFQRGVELESILSMPTVTQYARSIANNLIKQVIANDERVISDCDRDCMLPTQYILDQFRRQDGSVNMSPYFNAQHFAMLGLGSPKDAYTQIASDYQQSMATVGAKPLSLDPQQCLEQAVFNEMKKSLAVLQMRLIQTYQDNAQYAE